METPITWPEDLRAGDIFLGPIGGLVGLGVGLGQLVLGEGFRTGTLSIRHAAIVVEPARVTADGYTLHGPRLAQAMPSGAEVVHFDRDAHWTDRCAYVRLPATYAGQGGDAAAVALAMVEAGVGYGWTSYPALAAGKLGLKADWLGVDARRPLTRLGVLPSGRELSVSFPVSAICSRFVDFAWDATGYDVLEDTRPGVATPGMIADQMSCRQGVTWCRPRPAATAPARSWVV
jgi:hypothetical protein